MSIAKLKLSSSVPVQSPWPKPLALKQLITHPVANTWDKSVVVGEESQVLLSNLLTELGFTCKPFGDGKQKEADIEISMLIEVKCDVKSAETGNYAIEYLYKGQKSGIAATKATIFAIQTDTHFYLYRTDRLKAFIRANWLRLKKTKGGDDGETMLVLIPKLQMPEYSISLPIDKPLTPYSQEKSDKL